jgi:hypothetical protein
MNNLERREQNSRAYLALPMDQRKSCACLQPGHRATMCTNHPAEGLMCIACWVDHVRDDGGEPPCDACGSTDEYGDYCEAIVEESSTPTWAGVVDANVRWLCIPCADRLKAVRLVLAYRQAGLEAIVKLWLDADAPGHEMASDFGWCTEHPDDMRAYAELLFHLSEDHRMVGLCDACNHNLGTVPRGATMVTTPVGLVHVQYLAKFCVQCDQASNRSISIGDAKSSS